MMIKTANAAAVRRLESLFGKLRGSLASLGYICPGSVVKRYLPCGKSSCRCAVDPARRHGPYYEWSRKSRGKTVSVSLSSGQARFYREWVRNNRRLNRSLERMRAVSMRVAEHRARAAGWLLTAALAGLISLASSCATLPRDPVPSARQKGPDPFFDDRLATLRSLASSLWSRVREAALRGAGSGGPAPRGSRRE